MAPKYLLLIAGVRFGTFPYLRNDKYNQWIERYFGAP